MDNIYDLKKDIQHQYVKVPVEDWIKWGPLRYDTERKGKTFYLTSDREIGLGKLPKGATPITRDEAIRYWDILLRSYDVLITKDSEGVSIN